MGLFVNFGSPQSSFALNNNLATTLALGEEGGESVSTVGALDILGRADSDTFGQKDGKLSTFELYQYGNSLHNQIQMMRWMDNWMPWMGLGNWANEMEGQLNEVNVMLRNFGTIAGADNDRLFITEADIRKTAQKDGKADDLSATDLNRLVTTKPEPTPTPNPTPVPTGPRREDYLSRLNLVFDLADFNKDGVVSRDELLDQVAKQRSLAERTGSAAQRKVASSRAAAGQLMIDYYERLAAMDGTKTTLSKNDLFSAARLDGNLNMLSSEEIPELL